MAKLTEEERKEVIVSSMIYDAVQHAASSGLTETEARRLCEKQLTEVYRG